MKKLVTFMIVFGMSFSLIACSKDSVSKVSYDSNNLESMLDAIEKEVEDQTVELEEKTEQLCDKIGDTYESFTNNKTSISDFYKDSLAQSKTLYSKIETISIDYFKCVASQGLSEKDDWQDKMDDWGYVWKDGLEDWYQEWSGAYTDLYRAWDDALEEGYESTLSYDEYDKEYDGMYDAHDKAYDDMYDLQDKTYSDLYDKASAVRSGFYNKNKNVEELIKNIGKEEEEIVEEEAEEVEVDQTSMTGLRPEFKEAMDAYETFYQEYCDFLKNFDEDSADLTILTKYYQLIDELEEMDESFEEWEDEDLNDEELQYYLDVNSRVLQMLADVM